MDLLKQCYLSVPEAAEALRLHHQTVYRLIKRKELPGIKIAGRVLVDRQRLEKMLHKLEVAEDEREALDEAPRNYVKRLKPIKAVPAERALVQIPLPPGVTIVEHPVASIPSGHGRGPVQKTTQHNEHERNGQSQNGQTGTQAEDVRSPIQRDGVLGAPRTDPKTTTDRTR